MPPTNGLHYDGSDSNGLLLWFLNYNFLTFTDASPVSSTNNECIVTKLMTAAAQECDEADDAVRKLLLFYFSNITFYFF
jgi:hypothetical protein